MHWNQHCFYLHAPITNISTLKEIWHHNTKKALKIILPLIDRSVTIRCYLTFSTLDGEQTYKASMHIACSQEKIPRFAAHHRFVSCPSSSFSFSCHSTEKEWKEEHQCCAKQVWPILVEKLLLTRKKWGHNTGRHSSEDLVQWQSMIMGRLHHFWDMPFISS
jgi:hypothetical protein